MEMGLKSGVVSNWYGLKCSVMCVFVYFILFGYLYLLRVFFYLRELLGCCNLKWWGVVGIRDLNNEGVFYGFYMSVIGWR